LKKAADCSGFGVMTSTCASCAIKRSTMSFSVGVVQSPRICFREHACFVIARSDSDEAIQLFCVVLDCFASLATTMMIGLQIRP
jgi:hypothetical protein